LLFQPSGVVIVEHLNGIVASTSGGIRITVRILASFRLNLLYAGPRSIFGSQFTGGFIKLMQVRVATTAIVAAAMMFALSVGSAIAKSDKESCTSTVAGPPVEKTNTDGTECETEVVGTGKNKATATASGLSVAEALAEDGSTSKANASKGSQATAEAAAGQAKATSSGDAAGAVSEANFGGSATSKATGAHSQSVSEITGTGGGITESTAKGGGQAVSEVTSNGGGNAITNSDKGDAVAEVALTGGGTANATANGTGSQAVSDVKANCIVTTTAKGDDSAAIGQCQNSGSTVTISATKGSQAEGSDTTAPICTPMNGGEAKVRSPGGNCG
jgi:hypothetical protein